MQKMTSGQSVNVMYHFSGWGKKDADCRIQGENQTIL